MPHLDRPALNVVVDQRFLCAPDGSVWTHTPPDYHFLKQALAVFGNIRVIARTTAIDSLPAQARRLDGPGVELIPVPAFVGPFQYLRRRSQIVSLIPGIARLDGAFLLRIPSQTAFLVAAELDRLGRPYATELLTDPHDFFARGVSPHGLAYLFRPYFCRRSRQLCSRAVAANFITGSRTRALHPTPRAQWAGGVSDVDLPPEAFLPPRPHSAQGPLRIISVGFLDLLYKGQDVLIRALAQCHSQGLDFQLTFAGGGENTRTLLELAASLGIGSRVQITGPLGGPESVRTLLANSDLFTLPSRAEGIPRALLEAMAAGLPAICSPAGAMADLIEPRWIVPSGDVASLSARLLEFAASRDQWPAIGSRNQSAARSFERAKLLPKRLEFFEAIRDACFQASLPEWVSNVA